MRFQVLRAASTKMSVLGCRAVKSGTNLPTLRSTYFLHQVNISETSVKLYQISRCRVPEDRYLHNCRIVSGKLHIQEVTFQVLTAASVGCCAL